MTKEEFSDVVSSKQDAINEVGGVTQLVTQRSNFPGNLSGNLVKPNVPQGKDSEQQQINELVVAKMWKIVCLRKLQL